MDMSYLTVTVLASCLTLSTGYTLPGQQQLANDVAAEQQLANAVTATSPPTGNNTCPVLAWVNGCSSPIPGIPYLEEFTPTCNIHDVCYRCGAHFGWKQGQCDRAFKRNMKDVCETNYGKTKMNKFIGSWFGWKDWYDRVWDESKLWLNLLAAFRKRTQDLNGKASQDEIARIYKGVLKLFSLMKDWAWAVTADELKACHVGAQIYFQMVKTYGTYFYRITSPEHCKYACVEKIGQPRN